MEHQRENEYHGLDPHAVELVQKVARRIAEAEGFGFTTSDRKDLQQELMIAIWRGGPRHDPERGTREQLTSRMVRNCLRQLIRHQRAQCRDHRVLDGSLQDPETTKNGSVLGERGDFYDTAEYLRLTSDRLTDKQRTDLRFEISRVVAKLPADLTEVLPLLAEGFTKREVAEHLGIGRSTLYERLGRLEDAFRRAGLDKYVR